MTGERRITQRYDTVAILFHWTVAIMIVVNVCLAWTLGSVDRHSGAHDQILTIHKSIGTTIFVLAVLRLAWRWWHPAPSLPGTIASWQRFTTLFVQGLLYAVLVIMPLSGLIDAAAFSQPVHFFYLFDLPTVIRHNEPLGHLAFGVHKTAALALYAALFVHAAAALHHHYVLKDDILLGMLPKLKNSRDDQMIS